jgi:two-component system chemotaxis response regulator CheY
MRTLIVDDETSTCRILERILDGYGFNSRIATDGEQALKVLESDSDIGLILLDSVLPGLCGLDTLRAIRAQSRNRLLRVAMVTSQNDHQQVLDALAAGADEYLMKPIDQLSLLLKLKIIGVYE